MTRLWLFMFAVTSLPLAGACLLWSLVEERLHARAMQKARCMVCDTPGGPLCPRCGGALELRRAFGNSVHEEPEA